MNFQALTTASGGLGNVAADALIVVLAAGPTPVESGHPGLDKLVSETIESGDLELKAGQSLYLHQPQGLKTRRLVLVCAKDLGPKAFRAALSTGLGVLKGRTLRHIAVALLGAAALSEHGEALALAVEQAFYLYTHTKPSAKPPQAPAKLSLVCDKASAPGVKAGLALGQALAAGVGLAREYGNRPANQCTPSFLADEAKRLAAEFDFKAQVLDRKAVEKLGMGAFVAVAKGSSEPLKFIVLEYLGKGAEKDAPLVLVGKGITFDSGGISIKPAAEMDEMKFDMCGAASVLGSFRAIAELRPSVHLIGLIPACENMPDGVSVKPGDVVTSLSGKTIEILNTDAEGRLVLCDALTYAERFKPAAVVDIATLTGACMVALGGHHSGLFTPDDGLAGELLAASSRALDPCWRMPLDDEYDEALKSNFADMANVGPRAGGAITAAKFLQRFTNAYPWAHLDIAGVAWRTGAAKGSTGRPVGLLTHWVLARAHKD